MGFIGDLLGGGDKGTPSQVVDTTPPEFEGLRGDLSSVFRQLIGRVGGGTQPFGGQTTAPITGQEQNLVNMIGQQAGRSVGGGPAGDLLNQTISGRFLQPGSNPFLQQQIAAAQRPLLEAFNETTLPNLRSQFTAAGQMIQPGGSSPFDMAVARAQSGLMNALGDVSTNMSSENFQQERTRQQAAVNQQLQVSQGDMDNLLKGLQGSALPRLIQQQGISTGLSQFNKNVDLLMQALALATGASTGGNVVLPGSAGTDHGSLLSGLGSLGVGAGALMASDIRVKEDVKKIADTSEGYGLYSFRYKDNPFTHIGVIAQEVEKENPDAVFEMGGVKYVRTDKL